MTYFEGFIVPVPEANRDAYQEACERVRAARRRKSASAGMVEAWDSDVPEGKVTDFRKAVDAKPDEKIVFSCFEYPSKAERDAANEKMMSDPRMEEMGENMPFDGKRMIMGGFDAIVEEGSAGGAYTDGFVVPGARGQARRLSRARRENGEGLPPAWRDTGRSKRSATTCRTARSPTSIAR